MELYLVLYTPLMDEFTLQIHEIWPSLNPYGPSKCSGGVFERSIWNSKCSGGAFRILNAPLNASPRPVARSIGLGRLVNWTRPPGRWVRKTKLDSATRQEHLKNQILLGHPAGGPYISIFGQVPLPQFHMDCVPRWSINGLFRTNWEIRGIEY